MSFSGYDPDGVVAASAVESLEKDAEELQHAAYYGEVAGEVNVPGELPCPPDSVEQLPAPGADQLEIIPTPLSVADSVRLNFPMVREALAARDVASGQALSAWGAFDRNLKGYSNVQPLDFYENNWHQWGVTRDTMWGGQVGAGYRLGRGSFEPWYKERETNDLGELGVSITAPLIRDIFIDANRAELWRAQLEQGRVEPFIRAQMLLAVRDGLVAYWEWVAAGENLAIADEVLQLGVDRIDLLERQVELGEKAEIELVDNQRIIVSRRSKQIDARRKLQQAAVKLSLFFRTVTGQPQVVAEDVLAPSFPAVTGPEESALDDDADFALSNRPELQELEMVRRQLNVALRQACNEINPDVDGGLFFGQDIGAATSDDDKSDFEVEATLTVSVPLERRKARGKVREMRGKIVQLGAKRQMAADKVVAEVRLARAAMIAAAERVTQASEGIELADQMRRAEQQLYDQGQSNLFNLNIREQQNAEAASELVGAKLQYYVALADYATALGVDAETVGLE